MSETSSQKSQGPESINQDEKLTSIVENGDIISTNDVDSSKSNKKNKHKNKSNNQSSVSSSSSNVSAQPSTVKDSTEAIHNDLKRAFDRLQLKTATMGIGGTGNEQPKSREDALKKKYEFWETQPVPNLKEDDPPVDLNAPIHPPMQPEKIPKECLNLPQGFHWVSLNLNEVDGEEMCELYTLLAENYVEDDDNMFRFNYSREFLHWVLQAPGWNPDWFVGVRVYKPDQKKKGKLVGFISAIPSTIRVYDKVLETVEINFLCVHKKLRSKRMTPVLISEITRRIRLTGIFQALYTAGVFLPKPIATCRYYHRSLNPKKLIEVGFSHLTRNMTIPRTVKLYRLPEQPKLSGLRRFERNDIKQVQTLMNKYMERFDLVPLFSEEEMAHWLLPKTDVVDSYVVERTNETDQKKEIIGFFSFYILPSTVMDHKQYKEIRAAYSFYNVPSEHCSLLELMQDALIIAKNTNLDVFNALNQRDNEVFLKELKFGEGDGNLHYYLFNWKCPPMKPEKVGVVLQ
ncbi:glycylpeptide n-tetradecanoyltransferase 2-like protein [Dermatophagoides farinae]|uniref:Glycylpeptide N-tetradecanoyltransferase n=1 Tax=Dermatophagoides farinae TaxID=6954 RepID=A0A9D4SLY5_DERFA|nr:glycylpeptide N-tetradecanoyltransferase-like [Dermatophagoides farinae]KAH7646673.1 glycylpeptide n-tetradecanoyltransferase 2-like protein [Dermatophagoides farinae]